MDNKDFDIVKIILPEYENAFIFDLVDNTNIATACYLLRQKKDQVVVDKIVGLMTLLGNYQIESRSVTNEEFKKFMTFLKKWMYSENKYNNLNIDDLNETNFIENIRIQDYELIRSFIERDSSSIITMKKH